jgi:hypothetical protein
MSLATLGEHIDVHTGGEDNVFPTTRTRSPSPRRWPATRW